MKLLVNSQDDQERELIDEDAAMDAIDDNELHALIDKDEKKVNDDESAVYERAVSACGFGVYHYIILMASGWALASDSVEMQVVSFVSPSACDLEMTSGQKGWLNAIIFIGMMVGGFLFGGAADVKGRRYILLWSMTINGLGGLLSGFAPGYKSFLFFRFLSGVGVGAAMPIIFSYCAEFMSTKRRGPVIACLAMFWIVGNIMTCLMAWLIIPRVDMAVQLTYLEFSSWRVFVVVGAFPSLSAAAFMYFLPESPLYLTKIGNYEQAHDVLVRIFRRNFGQTAALPDELNQFSEYYKNVESPRRKRSGVENPDLCSFGRQLLEVLNTLLKVVSKTRRLFQGVLCSTTIMLIVIWISLSFGYYGLWMWLPEIFKRAESGHDSGCTSIKVTVNITKNLTCLEVTASNTTLYIESLVIAFSQVPGNFLTMLLVNKVGRRRIMAVSMVLAGISVFFFPLVGSRVGMVALLCVFSGMAIFGWVTLDMLSIENYPTELRSFAFGVQSVFGRIAAMTGNVAFGRLVDQHCSIPVILVAVLLAVGGLTSLKMPKTDDTPLT